MGGQLQVTNDRTQFVPYTTHPNPSITPPQIHCQTFDPGVTSKGDATIWLEADADGTGAPNNAAGMLYSRRGKRQFAYVGLGHAATASNNHYDCCVFGEAGSEPDIRLSTGGLTNPAAYDIVGTSIPLALTNSTPTLTCKSDGRVQCNKAGGLETGKISELTTGAGVTCEGLILRGGAIAAPTTITNGDSGTTYLVTQPGAGTDAITLPDPPLPGAKFKFAIGTADAGGVTISNGSAHLFGTIINDTASVLPATGTTLTFVGGTAAVGDTISIEGVDATHYLVSARTSTAGGITIA